ncbi:MAG: glycosyltransferase family 2 protein [Treponema sp.]|nr:glycosyltransferase family 2 protein [Treponema sp.]
MKISILLATYNGEKYFREQLDSILNQDFKDFTLYVSDDGSSDNTLKIIDYYSKKDERIKVLPKHEPNKSACKHFLYMLENVESDLFLFSDQDDVWTKDHISTLVEKYVSLSENEKKLPILIHSDLYVADKNLNIINKSFFDYALLAKKSAHKNSYFLENNVTGGVMLINKKLKDLVFINENYLRANIEKIPMHDQFFALLAFRFGKIIFIDKQLEFYRQHENNVVGAKNVKSIKNIFHKILSIDNLWLKKSQDFVLFFLTCYFDLLSAGERDVLSKFIDLRKFSKLKSVHFLIQNDFLKENRKRQILQILSILFFKGNGK